MYYLVFFSFTGSSFIYMPHTYKHDTIEKTGLNEMSHLKFVGAKNLMLN